MTSARPGTKPRVIGLCRGASRKLAGIVEVVGLSPVGSAGTQEVIQLPGEDRQLDQLDGGFQRAARAA